MPESLSHRLRLCRLPRLYVPRLPHLRGAGLGRSRCPAHQLWLHEAQRRHPPCCWPRWQQMSGALARSLRPFRRFQLVVGRLFLQPRWRRCAPAYCLFPLRQMQAVACCLLPRDPPVWRAALHPHVQALLHVAVQTVDGGRAYRRHQACRALPELGAVLRQALLLSGEREFLRPCKLPGTGRSAPSLAQCAIDRPRFCTRYRNWGNG